jgi:hypothetical protein
LVYFALASNQPPHWLANNWRYASPRHSLHFFSNTKTILSKTRLLSASGAAAINPEIGSTQPIVLKLSTAGTFSASTCSRCDGRPEKRGTRDYCACSGDRLASLEISQDHETGGSCREVLKRMSAQDRPSRINRTVIKFKQLGKRVKRCSDDPVRCAGVSVRSRRPFEGTCSPPAAKARICAASRIDKRKSSRFLQWMNFEKAPALILNRIGKGSCETYGKRSRI